MNDETILVGCKFIAKVRLFLSSSLLFLGVGDYVCVSYWESRGDISPIMIEEPSPTYDVAPMLNESRALTSMKF